jgi:integrase
MAHVRKKERPGRQTLYEVRYFDPAGRERSKSFKRRGDAERWLAANEVAKHSGSWVDPEHLKVRFVDWAAHFMATGLWKPKTRNDYESLLRCWILPALGPVPLGRIDQVAIKEWVATMHKHGLSPYRIRNAYRLLSKILKEAVEAGYLPRNVSGGVALPRIVQGDMTVLTAAEVARFAREMRADRGHDVLVEVLAYGGLRWGELAALRRARCELLRSRLHIVESLADVNGELIFQPTKTYERRYVRLPARVLENLARHLESVPASGDTLVFTSSRGTPLRNQNFRRSYWNPAVDRAGLPDITPHGLRHTCASLLVDQGADPVAVQQHLGHKDVATTLRIYRHLFIHRTDQIADALDALYAAAEEEADASNQAVTALSARRRSPA